MQNFALAMLSAAALFLVSCAGAEKEEGRAPIPVRADHSDHVARSTPIVTAWRGLAPGDPVAKLDELARDPQWIEASLFQMIRRQTGAWNIQIDTGYTVFRVYPYLAENSPQPRVYQGIIVKVNGDGLSTEDLKRAIVSRDVAIRICEYDLFGEGVDQYRRR